MSKSTFNQQSKKISKKLPRLIVFEYHEFYRRSTGLILRKIKLAEYEEKISDYADFNRHISTDF